VRCILCSKYVFPALNGHKLSSVVVVPRHQGHCLWWISVLPLSEPLQHIHTYFHDVLCTPPTGKFLWWFILHTQKWHHTAYFLLPSCALDTSVTCITIHSYDQNYCNQRSLAEHQAMSTQIVIPGCSIIKPELYWYSQHVLKNLNPCTGKCIWKLSMVTSEACNQMRLRDCGWRIFRIMWGA